MNKTFNNILYLLESCVGYAKLVIVFDKDYPSLVSLKKELRKLLKVYNSCGRGNPWFQPLG